MNREEWTRILQYPMWSLPRFLIFLYLDGEFCTGRIVKNFIKSNDGHVEPEFFEKSSDAFIKDADILDEKNSHSGLEHCTAEGFVKLFRLFYMGILAKKIKIYSQHSEHSNILSSINKKYTTLNTIFDKIHKVTNFSENLDAMSLGYMFFTTDTQLLRSLKKSAGKIGAEIYSDFLTIRDIMINPHEVATWFASFPDGQQFVPLTLAELLTDQDQAAPSARQEEMQIQLDSRIPINISPSLWAGKTLPVAYSTLAERGYELCVIAAILEKLSSNKTECGRALAQDELTQGVERDPKTYQNKFKNLLEEANSKYLLTFND